MHASPPPPADVDGLWPVERDVAALGELRKVVADAPTATRLELGVGADELAETESTSTGAIYTRASRERRQLRDHHSADGPEV